MSLLLPLFPLDLVLLPGVPLPLHVFEPRYKEMIAECLDEKKPFGVVRASSNGVAEIGCTAEIVEVTKRYDDGRMDILTRGVERFEVLQVHEERTFLEAEFTVIEDEPGTPTSDLVQKAVHLHGEIVKLAGADAEGPEEGAEHLSFLLAGGPEGNHHDCFEGDRLPVFGGRTEFPARQSAFGQCVETIVRTCEDANFSDRAIGMDDRVERNCALHIRPHQFDRIAGVGFLDRVWRAQFTGLLARLEFGKTDHPAAG